MNMADTLPVVVALIVAVIGGAGGFAALMKVNADNSKLVSEGATNVVKLLRDQVADMDARLSVVERYSQEMEVWSAQVVVLMNKAIANVPDRSREPFRIEADALAQARPRRQRLRAEKVS